MTNIAVFDSGVGGLTLLAALRQVHPQANYLYYADLAHVPYGNKNPEEIKKYIDQMMQAVIPFQPDVLILACNTATSVAINSLRATYERPDFHIVGMEPAVKPAAHHKVEHNKRIVVTATDLTLKLEKLNDLINSLHIGDRIIKLSLQALVTFAEQGLFDGAEVEGYLKDVFKKTDWSEVQTLVLGCTHFIYFYPIIRRLLPANVAIIDGNSGTVRRVMSLIPKAIDDHTTPTIRFMTSGQTSSESAVCFFEKCLKRAEAIIK